MINIAGLTPVDDPSYRYKMPRILPKVEGRGNGIKTVLVNIVDIGTALNRDAPEITKFFGFELGAQTTFSVEEDSRAVVNGSHSSQDLQQLLTKYIEMFVLCKNCKLPETHYKIKGGIINQKCLACGSKESCDMTHKLTTFILKQHQKAKADDPDKEKKKEKKEKKEKSESSNGAGEEVKEKKPKKDKEKSAEKEKKPKKDKKKDEDHVNEDGVEEEDEEETDSDAIDTAIDQFRQWSLNNSSVPITGTLNELRSIQTLSSLRPADRIIIYLGTTFTPTAIADNLMEKNKTILHALAPSEIQQRHLIAATEWFCGCKQPHLLRMFPIMLKQMYDADLVDEDVFYAWATDYARNEFSAEESLISIDTLEALKVAAQPFINWLQQAEEEDDGEEGDDDNADKVEEAADSDEDA